MPKILVIEDELSIRKLLNANLTASGYEVFVADDGEEGLGLAHMEYPDLILLDLLMPRMSGTDVLIGLKANPKLQKTPVIIITASLRRDEKDKIHSLGIAGYMTKPFSMDELLRRVKQVLGE